MVSEDLEYTFIILSFISGAFICKGGKQQEYTA